MERVELKQARGIGCSEAGRDIFIELSQDQISCKIEHNGIFLAGHTFSWTGSDLGTCHGKDFNVGKKIITFKMTAASSFGCPLWLRSLTITMDNGYSYKTGITSMRFKNRPLNGVATRI